MTNDKNNDNDNNNDNDHNKSDEVLILDSEKELVLDHNYDGIQELDHPLPSWWTATFVGTVIFGLFYVIFYLWAGGPTLKQEFDRDMIAINQAKAKLAAQIDSYDAEVFHSLNNVKGIKQGLEVFTENCMACHEEGGRGDIGPNLTDNYWLLSKGTPESIYPIINKGNEDNGMPAWGEIIPKKEMYAVLAYIMSIKGSNPKGAKEPQGTEYP